MKKILMVFLFGLLFLSISNVSAVYVCETYDDFSSGSLNLSKWEEITSGAGATEIEQHYVNTTNQNYHTAQTFTANRGVQLKMLENLQAGDIIKFDLIYNSATGNHFGCAFWDDSANWYLTNSITCIGQWDIINAHNGEYGTWHYEALYNTNSVNITRILPNGTIENWNSSTGLISAPYEFSIHSRTGSNGMLHFDYDNFEICRDVSSNYTCIDNDGGFDVFTLSLITSNLNHVWWDQCIQYIGGIPHSSNNCSGLDCFLYEMSCQQSSNISIIENGITFDGVNWAKVNCPNGCSHGVCINSKTPAINTNLVKEENSYNSNFDNKKSKRSYFVSENKKDQEEIKIIKLETKKQNKENFFKKGILLIKNLFQKN